MVRIIASFGDSALAGYTLAHPVGLGPSGAFIAIAVAESLVAVVG